MSSWVHVRGQHASQGDQDQPEPQQVARADPDGELAGDRGDGEGEHGDGQEPESGGEGTVAEHVLHVERQVEEHGEDGGGQRERGERHADHGRPLEQRQVEHRILHPPLGDEEDGHQDARSDEQADDERTGPTLGVPLRRARTPA